MSIDNEIEYRLCNQNDMTENSMKEFEIDLGEAQQNQKVKVLLIKQNNKLYCIGPKCSHYQVPLVNGVLYKDRVRCMAHGACFNIKTGDIEDYPGPDCIPKFDVYLDSSNDVYLRATIHELLTVKRVKSIKNRIGSSKSNSLNIKYMIPKCLIIGSGAAGLVCLDTLREFGYGSNITMITQENYLPYDRPKLSKMLNSKINNIAVRDEEYFKTNQINFHTNQKVERIDFNKREVYCESGKVYDYDKLIIATGLKAAESQQKPGSDLKGIFTLRSLDDANNIMKHFDEITQKNANGNETKKLNIVVVGGSFISMEAASFFADKANVTVLARRKPFETAFGNLASTKIQKLHESKGIKFYIHNKFDITDYKECKVNPGCLGSLKIVDGSEWPADICLLAIGGKPAASFLKNSPIKLTLDNFIFVNKYMKTNVDNVYAAGDITFFPRACLPGLEFTLSKHNKKLDHLNISHWGLAGSQGKIAALSIIGEFSVEQKLKDESFQIVPFFWTAQHGKMIRFAGYNEQYDIIIFHEDKTKQNELKFAAFYLLSNRVVGVCTLDWDPVCALFAEAMTNRIEIRKEHIENDPIDIKKLLN